MDADDYDGDDGGDHSLLLYIHISLYAFSVYGHSHKDAFHIEVDHESSSFSPPLKYIESLVIYEGSTLIDCTE